MLQPTMTGQTHDMHLQANEESTQEYSNDVARYWVQMMQAVKERFHLDAQKVTSKVARKKRHKNFLVTYSLTKGLKKFKSKGYNAAKGE